MGQLASDNKKKGGKNPFYTNASLDEWLRELQFSQGTASCYRNGGMKERGQVVKNLLSDLAS